MNKQYGCWYQQRGQKHIFCPYETVPDVTHQIWAKLTGRNNLLRVTAAQIFKSVTVLIDRGKSPSIIRLNLELAAQAADVHVDGSGLQVSMLVPDILEDIGAR